MSKNIEASLDKFRILVVDDSPTQLIQLQHMLENRDYQVSTAGNGSEALTYLEREVPSLVISDIVMPGIDGYQLCEKIKQNPRTAEVPVILLTSLSNPEDVLEGLACGADNFIIKPFSNEYLLTHVEQILTTKQVNRTKKVRLDLEINFFGKRRFITADQQQMLTLLLSTYEAAVMRNNELVSIQEELRTLNDNLEDLVEERTHELREHQEKYLDLYNYAPVMFLTFDPKSLRIMECNDTLVRRIGYKKKELIGNNLVELFFPENRNDLSASLKGFSELGLFHEIELSLVTRLGTFIPVMMRASALKNQQGAIMEGRAVFQDLTGLKRAEEEVLQSEERYRAVADSAVDAIITLDSAGLIVGWNKAAENLFGYSEEEMSGETVTRILPDHSRQKHHEGFDRIREGGEPRLIGKTVEMSAMRKGGAEFPIELSLASWRTADGQFFTGIIRDISARKTSEKELLEAKQKAEESDKLKSAFLANMSHEIRTPMNGIIGFVQLLEDPDITPEERRSFIEIIKTSSNRLLQVITDIVDISKIESGQEVVVKKEFNLVKLAQEVIALYKPKAIAKKLSLELVSSLDFSQTNLYTDPVKLRQALCHLVDNGLKFTTHGGVELDVGIRNNILICKINDTGIGIASELHDRIFDRFRQEETDIARKYGGTGLGLSLAKSYVEMLDGTIWLTSTPGKGSTFVIEIPVSFQGKPSDKVQKPADEAVPPPVEFADITVLIAEDEIDNATYLRLLLERLNISLLFAGTGEEAIDVCKKHPELSLILMDVKMPVMDGLEATRIIRKFRPDMPIVATTAFAMGSDKERCLAAGCNEYLSKPIKKELLIETIKHLVS